MFPLPLGVQSSPDDIDVLEVDSTPLGMWLLQTHCKPDQFVSRPPVF